MDSERGRAALRSYFDRYIALALAQRRGFVLESPTWRANPDWGAKARLRSLSGLPRSTVPPSR